MTDAGFEPRKRRASSATIVLRRAQQATKGVRVGRPASYSPALCDRAIAIGLKGGSWAAIATEFGLSRNTLSQWEGQYPEFKEALARAKAAAQAWHETHGRKGLKAKHYQGQVLKTLMSGQFDDYREKQSSSLADGVSDLIAAITEAADRRRQKAVQAQPGDAAKAVEPLDVVIEPPKG